jgi:long-chain acyl-CoA synthetase
MLSNKNFLSAITNIFKVGEGYEVSSSDVYLSYLPLAHVFDRLGAYTALSVGAGVGFFGGEILKLNEDMKLLKPSVFPAVPRLLNKIYDKIMIGLKT